MAAAKTATPEQERARGASVHEVQGGTIRSLHPHDVHFLTSATNFFPLDNGMVHESFREYFRNKLQNDPALKSGRCKVMREVKPVLEFLHQKAREISNNNNPDAKFRMWRPKLESIPPADKQLRERNWERALFEEVTNAGTLKQYLESPLKCALKNVRKEASCSSQVQQPTQSHETESEPHGAEQESPELGGKESPTSVLDPLDLVVGGGPAEAPNEQPPCRHLFIACDQMPFGDNHEDCDASSVSAMSTTSQFSALTDNGGGSPPAIIEGIITPQPLRLLDHIPATRRQSAPGPPWRRRSMAMRSIAEDAASDDCASVVCLMADEDHGQTLPVDSMSWTNHTLVVQTLDQHSMHSVGSGSFSPDDLQEDNPHTRSCEQNGQQNKNTSNNDRASPQAETGAGADDGGSLNATDWSPISCGSLYAGSITSDFSVSCGDMSIGLVVQCFEQNIGVENGDLLPVTSMLCRDKLGDSGVYTGSIAAETGLPHGHGCMSYNSGAAYLGNWEHGQWNGTGRLAELNGDTYEGQFVHGVRQGNGEYIWSNGDVYRGSLQSNAPHGCGKLCFHDGCSRYEGGFANGLYEGFGRFDFSGGWYEGEWKAGRYHYGELRHADGSGHKGGFQDSVAHGPGVQTLPNGQQLQGMWVRGQLVELFNLAETVSEEDPSSAGRTG